jgi:hypothetical protein
MKCTLRIEVGILLRVETRDPINVRADFRVSKIQMEFDSRMLLFPDVESYADACALFARPENVGWHGVSGPKGLQHFSYGCSSLNAAAPSVFTTSWRFTR